MANYCFNSIEINGDANTIKILEAQFKAHIATFNSMDAQKIHEPFTTFVDRLLGLPEAEEYDSYKYDTRWIDFHNISTEETNYDGVKEVSLFMSGMSAWEPPLKMCQELSRKYNLEIEIEFEEEGLDFAGKAVYESGNEVSFKRMAYREYFYNTDKEDAFYNMIVVNDLEYSMNSEESLEDFLETYPFASEVDKLALKFMWEDAKEHGEYGHWGNYITVAKAYIHRSKKAQSIDYTELVSNCCSAPEWYDESGICSQCKEHSDFINLGEDLGYEIH